MLVLKGQWTVTAGIIPGQVESQYTKSWLYNSDDLARDQYQNWSLWHQMKNEAHEYAKSITDPSKVNWVAVDWMWV